MASDSARETRAFAAEVKFLVPHATGAAIRDWARRFLQPDPHGTGPSGDEYRTSTIYFDSPEFDVYHRRGSFGRSKYRIRQYEGAPDVFLERKLRRPGMLAKRRTPVAAVVLPRLEDVADEAWPGQWFHRRLLLRRLKPVCEISYHRVARIGSSATGAIRLTIDDGLRVVHASRPSFSGSRDGISFIDPCMILELKYRSAVPALFKQLIEEFSLVPHPASKYRSGILAIEPQGIGPAATNGSSPLSVDASPCA